MAARRRWSNPATVVADTPPGGLVGLILAVPAPIAAGPGAPPGGAYT
ncbi:MAG: hypothetical protein V7637_6077 [Mycobacteriales bacterium]|jgi:hypothetical protein